MNTSYEDLRTYIYDIISLNYSQHEKYFRLIFIGNRNTNFMFSTFFSENRVICEIKWKKMVEPDTPQMTIWRMHFACWTTKAAETHSE